MVRLLRKDFPNNKFEVVVEDVVEKPYEITDKEWDEYWEGIKPVKNTLVIDSKETHIKWRVDTYLGLAESFEEEARSLLYSIIKEEVEGYINEFLKMDVE